MTKSTTPAQYKKTFIARLKAIREAAGYTQTEFARGLGLKDRDAYAKYESRSLLPHHLITKVCDLTGHDPYFLLTGNPPKPSGTREILPKAG